MRCYDPLMTTVVTIATEGRIENLRNLRDSLRIHAPETELLIVTVGKDPFVPWEGARCVHNFQDGPFNAAKARNIGLHLASQTDDTIIGLDADCIVGKNTIALYEDALRRQPEAVTIGPINWLNLRAQDIVGHIEDIDILRRKVERTRRFPADGEMQKTELREYWLFFSGSYAMRSSTWRKCVNLFGGFCEEYEGWGLEDTDFGLSLHRHEIETFQIGGAVAYHQKHDAQWPPIDSVDYVAKNANLFLERNGFPHNDMLGPLDDLGMIEIDETGYVTVLKHGRDLPDWIRKSTVLSAPMISE